MTLASAAITSDGRVVNLVAVNINANREIQGWRAPTGQNAVVLPDGSPVGIGWDYISNNFYAPLPVDISLIPGQSQTLNYTIEGDLPTGVTFANNTLSAASDATVGSATVTLSDSATNRTAQTTINIIEVPAS